jgi:hypothetical protein
LAKDRVTSFPEFRKMRIKVNPLMMGTVLPTAAINPFPWDPR